MASYKVHNSNIKPLPPRLPATQFWGLCFIVYMLLQFPVVRIPISFLSTWSHELGHGMGAVFTGGTFEKLTIYPNFSGTALTGKSNNFQHLSVLFLGLLGPSVLGIIMIFMTRALNWYRLSLIVLTVLLLMSQIWAADTFTRVTLGSAAIILGLIAWKLPHKWVLYIAHILAIALCLDAATSFGYFFMGGGVIDGRIFRSDTGKIGDILGGPHWFWGGLLVVISVAMLAAGVILSDKWARKHDRA